jgi:hypothetical protein
MVRERCLEEISQSRCRPAMSHLASLFVPKGPHDKHMTEKLNQMDFALSATLEVLDTSNKCHLALIFGDHGMTEEGCVSGATDVILLADRFLLSFCTTIT